MTKTELFRRLELLQEVIAHSRGLGYFNAWQLMCLHQERSSIYAAIEEIGTTEEEAATPEYKIPEHLEKRLRRVADDFRL